MHSMQDNEIHNIKSFNYDFKNSTWAATIATTNVHILLHIMKLND